MSCKSAIFAANTASQALSAGSVINFGSIVRKFGCNCNLSGGNLTLDGSGYYDIDANFTLLGTAAGTATISLYKDGTAIPGASAQATLADGDSTPVSISAIVRSMCCYESTITAVLTGVACTVSNAAISMEKI